MTMGFTRENARERGHKGGRTRSLKMNLDSFIDRPVEFMKELVDPESGDGSHFDPYPAQVRFLEEGGRLTKEIMPDRLHPNTRGYEIWAEAMEPSIRKLLGE